MLETLRLHFSPLDSSHLEKLLPIYNDALTMKYIPNNPSSWTEVELRQKFCNNFKDIQNGIGVFAVTEKTTGFFIGQAGIYNSFDDFKELEIGYILSSNYWHQGYGTEIAKGLIHHCFTNLKAHKVITRMYSTHLSSIRISEKSGMNFVEKTALDDSLYRSTYSILNLK
ncbi:GNAT family N-acetyltransferase [Flavobacterium sp. NKUCC04_CG]|uniref:GNAT family N-acetyltransferase n=1 Tax=Flavobacterium sp. NKUCC04_CG TaxID=2842121 RepID=UPI001C5B00D7|nr:GNAT family N-acetyltransferase [Flavobacterium sp. NKUCC04_CG]MBW3520376.1 GNAT family N-acetyltransferase [Flavobacterium sp. NKUCC04_CG]